MSRFGRHFLLALLFLLNFASNSKVKCQNVDESYCKRIQSYCQQCFEFAKPGYQKCENGGEFHEGRCHCSSGFSGTHCESRTQRYDCNCLNGGQCYNGRCHCSEQFTGTYCETRIQPLECRCENDGQCFNGQCHCSSGFTGRYCETKLGCVTQLVYDEALKDYVHPPNCLPVCNKPEIKHPLYEVDSNYIVSNGRHKLTKFELQCAHGYRLSGSSTLNCVSDDQWHPSTPQCHATNNEFSHHNEDSSNEYSLERPSASFYPIKNCSDPGTPMGGRRTMSTGRGTLESGIFAAGTQATFSCYSGYHLEGERVISCSHYGTWSADIPRCVFSANPPAVNCPQPWIHHGNYHILNQHPRYGSRYHRGYSSSDVAGQSTAKPGDTVRYTCDHGYQLVGSAESECLSYGQWRTQAPHCQASCGSYPGYRKLSEASEAPWHVSINQHDTYGTFLSCGATLISNRFIVTAASCVTYENSRDTLPTDTLKLHLVNLQETSPNTEYTISRIILHANYDANTKDSDIALIELESPINPNDKINPICLPDERQATNHEIPEATTGIVTVVASIGGFYTLPQQLQQSEMAVINRTSCQRELNRDSSGFTLSNNMFCAIGPIPEVSGTCHGHTGGSFAVSKDNYRTFTFQGILNTRNPGCDSEYTIFLNVARYVAWIREHEPLQ